MMLAPCSNIEPSRDAMGDDTIEQDNAESPGSGGASPYRRPHPTRRLALSISLPYPVALPWRSLPQLAPLTTATAYC
jgi:hypothetical protein